MRHKLALSLLAACAVVFSSTPASAIDMTGTWEGTFKCTIFGDSTSGLPVKTKDEGVIVEISDSAGDLDIFVTWGSTLFAMNGVVFADAKKATRSQGIFVDCANNGNVYNGGTDAIWHAKIKEKSNGSIQFKGSRLDGAFDRLQTCKFKFDRTSAADPVVGPCP